MTDTLDKIKTCAYAGFPESHENYIQRVFPEFPKVSEISSGISVSQKFENQSPVQRRKEVYFILQCVHTAIIADNYTVQYLK